MGGKFLWKMPFSFKRTCLNIKIMNLGMLIDREKDEKFEICQNPRNQQKSMSDSFLLFQILDID
jgi:hypothetical protein